MGPQGPECGGFRKVFALADVRNVTVMPHTFYEGPGLLAGVHTTAVPGTADAMIEWRFFDLEPDWELIRPRRDPCVPENLARSAML